MTGPVEWPLAGEVARCLVEASKIEGEDPIAVASGRLRSRARVYAFIVLARQFPTVGHTKMMCLCGAPKAKAFSHSVSAVQVARGYDSQRGRGDWFSLDNLNRVVEACGWPLMSAEDAKIIRQPKGLPKEMVSLVCLCCSEPFEIPAAEANRPGRGKFCSNSCRMKYQHAHGALKRPERETDTAVIEEFARAVERVPGAVVIAPADPVPDPGDKFPVTDEPVDIPPLPKPALPSPPKPITVSPAAKALAEFSAAKRPHRAVALKLDAPPDNSSFFERSATEPARTLIPESPVATPIYRPDRPLASRRDVVVLTSEFCGDPAPGRSALDERRAQSGAK